MSSIETIPLAVIDFKGSPKVRAELDPKAVKEYSEIYKCGETIKPPDVFRGANHYFLVADGLHRLEGARLAKVSMVPCTVHDGDELECIKFALKANALHGVKRSEQDKLLTIRLALVKFKEKSDRTLADMCVVSPTTIGKFRAVMEGEHAIPKVETRTASDGSRVSQQRAPSHKKTNVSTGGHFPSDDTSRPSVKKSESVLDSTKYPIPEELHDLWNRRHEYDELTYHLQAVMDTVERAAENKDPLFWELNPKDVTPAVKSLVSFIRAAFPYAVCLNCQGRKESNCTVCRNNRFISLVRWRQQPEKLREIRTKQHAK